MRSACVLLVSLLAVQAAAQYSLEPAGPFAAGEVAPAVKSLLEEGHRVKDPSGAVFVEAWLRKTTPTGKAAEQPRGADFTVIPLFTLLGVIRYAAPGADYRGQPVKPGVYTMRYNLHPEDGDHQGVAPRRDFVLLIPAAADPGPDARLNFDAAVDLSRKASGTTHPSVLYLLTPESGAAFPSVQQRAGNHQVLQVKSGTLALGITVVGKSDE